MSPNSFLDSIYFQFQNGLIKYESRKGNNYFFYDDSNLEVCYNVLLESISIAKLSQDGKKALMYLDKNNIDNNFTNFDPYTFYSVLEIILEMVMDSVELQRLDDSLESLSQQEKYEEAARLRDIIQEIKKILFKL